MDSLIKQTRGRFSGTRQDNKDDGIQPQRTQSVKEKKRGPTWIKRQVSRQMSWDYDFSGADYPAAVAAAAYAIQSLEESKSRDQRDATSGGSDKTLKKMKSIADEAAAPPERLRSTLMSSDEASNQGFKDRDSKKKPEKAPSMNKRISFADTDETTGKKREEEPEIKEPKRTTSMRRPATFSGRPGEKAPESAKWLLSPADKQLNITDSKTPETRMSPAETVKPLNAKPEPGVTKADAWETEELASIQDKCKKLKAAIDDWETRKTKKAQRKKVRIEAELDKRKAKAVKKYNSKISRIEEIARGARAQAEEKKMNQEFKAKEKANKIRSTGKLPATCQCGLLSLS